MNSCVLMAQIQEAPKLRKTQDNQSIAEMLVQIEGGREDDPPATLKVVAWGNLAEDVHRDYFAGDRVIVVGRLKMTTVEREEKMGGPRFKEKRAELIASSFEKISGLAYDGGFASSSSEARPSNVISIENYNKPPTSEAPAPSRNKQAPEATPVPSKAPAPPDDADLDDIPF